MSRNLAAEITAWMVENRAGGTLADVTAGVRARRADVLDVLRSDARFAQTVAGGSKVWFFAATSLGTARNGKSKPPTHNDLILRALADGKWHTSAELHREVFCVLHSRIHELRTLGFPIEHRGGGGGAANHEYRLLAQPEAVAA